MPMVVALGDDILRLSPGSRVVLDGDNGTLDVDADHTRLAQAERRLEWNRRRKDELVAQRAFPAVTTDGRVVTLLCNASTAEEVALGLAAGAEGVGLLRTELAFLDSSTWPSERDHCVALAPVLGLVDGRTATVRTLDFGADKTPRFLEGTAERGLALMLAHPDSLAAQLRAIVASAGGSNLRILLPLVEEAEQVTAVRALLDEPIVLGAMIETPKAVRHAGEIAEAADFLSIGTNDLIQYTLAIDRTDDSVAHLYDPLHPAVLSLISHVLRAGEKAKIPVALCGEMAGDIAMTRLLLGLGLRQYSMHSAHLLDVKDRVLHTSFAHVKPLAQRMLRETDPDRLQLLLERLNA
jgi:phosphotransferase system enzyme I (PtsI)